MTCLSLQHATRTASATRLLEKTIHCALLTAKAGEAEAISAEEKILAEQPAAKEPASAGVSTTTWLIIVLAVILVAIIIGLTKSSKKPQ